MRKIPGVATAVVVAGPYDAIARVVADDFDSLGKPVVTKIQAVEGMTRTLTCPVVHLFLQANALKRWPTKEPARRNR